MKFEKTLREFGFDDDDEFEQNEEYQYVCKSQERNQIA